MYSRTVLAFPVIVLLMAGLLVSCYKKEIQFGDNLAESHTRLITVDTVTPVMSTYVLDSFATSGANIAFIGRYNDNWLGNTTASTYLQFGAPYLSEDVATLIPVDAVYDSLVIMLKPNGYYYGDSTKPFNIAAYRLAAQPDYSDGIKLYNTSSIRLMPGPLSTFSKKISSAHTDSVMLRLPDNLGQDFFYKIKSRATEVQNEDNFLSYFNGVCLQPQGNDAGAVYSFNLADSSVRMRLHYHVTLPYFQNKVIEFYTTRTSYQFNRIITDRTGTPLQPTTPRQYEFFASPQNPVAFTQSGTGTLLKIKFPSLRELLKMDEVVRLLDAKLILKPVNNTFDNYVYRLPNVLYMAATDATNNMGAPLTDSTGSTQFRAPDIDFLYGVNTGYTFDLTNYINFLLNTQGVTENGLFVLQEDPTASKQLNRAVFGSSQHPKFQTKLVLTLMTID